jgi:hypothetical protein
MLQTIDARTASLDTRIKELRKKFKESAQLIKNVEAAIKKQKSERDTLMTSVPAALVMKERSEPRPAHILIRGAYDQPGEPVQRNTPAMLPPLPESDGAPDRMDFAEWLVAPENPLTARVAVNRFWQQLFGTGIVKTSEDFGAQGMWPSHPKLLDHLTLQFMESGWDVKAFMKSLVLSETYQQSSSGNSVDFETDPENLLLARGARTRLDSKSSATNSSPSPAS